MTDYADERRAGIERSMDSASDTPETDAAAIETCSNCEKLRQENAELRTLWIRDSTGLGIAIGQRNTARAVAQDHKVRCANTERQRDELADALRELASYFYTGNNVRVTRVTFLRRAPEIQRMLSLLARIDAAIKAEEGQA